MKHLPSNDTQFYPTPKSLILKMLKKVAWHQVKDVLDPSAGKGNLINLLSEKSTSEDNELLYNDESDDLHHNLRYKRFTTYAIEIDPHLALILKEKHKLLDHDFLQYNGGMTFDLIIMNPPFENGDKHLLHAFNFVFSGQIVCLLNAETIKNPYSNTRKALVQKLEELNADIEYIQHGFSGPDSERKTNVEVALIYIKIEQNFDELYCKNFDKENDNFTINDGTDVQDINKKKTAYDYIEEYEFKKNKCIDVITSHFKQSYGVREYFLLSVCTGSRSYSHNDSFKHPKDIKLAINNVIAMLKAEYWRKVFELPQFRERLTEKETTKFENFIKSNYDLEFNEHNINLLYEHLLDNSSKLIEDAIEHLFDKIVYKYSYSDNKPNERNIHMYNGWKTNAGYKINKRFILPFYGYTYEKGRYLLDIELVFSYFNNGIKPFTSLSTLYNKWKDKLIDDSALENELFKLKVYKKGTIHFTVKDESLLRRFNVYMSKRRQWLPPDYAYKPYQDCSTDEQEIIKSFEGEKEYTKNLNDPLMIKDSKQILMITAA